MAITVRGSVQRNLRETVILLLLSEEPAGRLAASLTAAVAEIRVTGGDWRSAPGLVPGMINGPSYVCDPIPVPGGYLIEIDFAQTPAPQRRAVPGILTRHLEDAGVADAEIRLAPGMSNRRFEFLDGLGPAARAWLLGLAPDPGAGLRPLRPWLTELALDWLSGRHQAGLRLLALIGSTEVQLTRESVRPAVTALLAANQFPALVSSDFKATAAAAALSEFHGPGVTLNAADASWSATQVAEAMRAQRDLIRAHAGNPELRWATVTVDPSLGHTVMHSAMWDELGFGPMLWYQLLSGRQLDRLGGPPADSVQLPGGRTELTVGEPEQWLPGHPDRDAVRARAAELLTPRNQQAHGLLVPWHVRLERMLTPGW